MSTNTVVLMIGTILSMLYVMKQFMIFVVAIVASILLYIVLKRARTNTKEGFIDIYHGSYEVDDDIVPCDVYYTNNKPECDANMYFQTEEEIALKLRSPHLTVAQRTSLQKVQNDMNSRRLPFPHQCKTQFGNWKQLANSPVKNANKSGLGHPRTWAFCYNDKVVPGLKQINQSRTQIKVNGMGNHRFDFKTLAHNELKPDFCSQYVVPPSEVSKLDSFHRHWLLGVKVNKTNGSILDVKSFVLNYQDITPHSNLYELAKVLFHVRIQNGQAVFGGIPNTYPVMRVFWNHCGKIANVTSMNATFNNVISTPVSTVYTTRQMSNPYGITMQELVTDLDKPIAFNTTCPFLDGNVRCSDGTIYKIENRKKRYYSANSYEYHQYPRYNQVDCTVVRSYCPDGPWMPQR